MRWVVPLLLLVAIGGWAWLAQSAASVPAAMPTRAATAAPVDSESVPEEGASTAAPQGLIGQATPWGAAGLEPTAVPTATSVAIVAPGAVALYGPPAGSRFMAGDTVAFYWSWPDTLAEGQQFVLYLLNGDERRPLGRLDEANLGSAYQLQVTVEQTGDFRWAVVLEDTATGATIGLSENRAISVIGG